MFALLVTLALAQAPAWKSLPVVEPAGTKAHTGSFVVKDRAAATWTRPNLPHNEQAATGQKQAGVVVLIYDPVLKSQGNVRLTDWLKGTDPEQGSRILADVVRQASWGYLNYDLVEIRRIDGYPPRTDGTRYDEASYLEVRRTKQWYEAPTSYRRVFEENGLVKRCKTGEVREVWIWGADGFHIDEFAGYIPNRYARYGPTDNPWFYRPYDIPPEIGRTTWVMGFNIEVGVDNAIHSYSHRVESMAALAFGNGVWDVKKRDDPWNLFSRAEQERPGEPAHVGNCHLPPNGQSGYDYNNKRSVLSYAWTWWRFPDLRGTPHPITPAAWGNNQFGYQKWLLERLPKGPGATEFGPNNWWVPVANTDEDLPALAPIDGTRLQLPEPAGR